MAMQPNKGSGGSAAAKRLAEQKASRMGKRTDKAGSVGFGMTRSGVEDRAASAEIIRASQMYPSGQGDYDKYSGLATWAGYGGTPRIGGKKISYARAGREMDKAGDAVRKKYGVAPRYK